MELALVIMKDAKQKGPADCVRCGACTTVCPVWRVTGREIYCARGKHHVMERLAAAERTAAYAELLSKCLLCGACQAVCSRGLDTPGQVVAARAALPGQSGSAFFARRLLAASPTLLARSLLAAGSAASRLLPERSGLRLRLAALVPGEIRLPAVGYLDSISRSIPGGDEKRADSATCSYFAGCFANHLEPQVAEATSRLVARLTGATPAAPLSQGCCGLAHLAAGELKEARRLAKENITAFGGSSLPILVSCASCYAHLSSYPELLADEPDWQEQAKDFRGRLREFSTFFASLFAEGDAGCFDAAGQRKRVLYHDPCHLRFSHQITAAPRALLGRLAGVELAELASGPKCCGQGGLFSLAHPELSGQIFDRLFEDFAPSAASFVVTTCSGCLLQWRQGLARHGSKAGVAHLAVFMREFLEDSVPR